MRRQEERGSLGRPKELRLATILARYVANKRFHADYPPRRGEERPLRDTEELFRSLANTLPVMIWMSGVDNLCTFFNEPKLKFAGRSLESVVGSGWTESVHPEDLHRCWAISNCI
jgi:PAS domain-containing protein